MPGVNVTCGRAWGVTLVELLIVVTLMAILIAMAIPSYRGYVIRSQRTDAAAALLRVQSAQEKFFVQHHRYAADLAAPPPAGLGLSLESPQGHYLLTLEAGAGDHPSSFTATAVPRPDAGPVDDERCQQFSVDHQGTRRAYDAAGVERTSECWR